MTHTLDPKLDLVLERTLDVKPEQVWAAWTRPELLKQWFTPAPWQTVDAVLELHPGGAFHTTMRSPEGDEFPSTGCVLEVVENRRLAWTAAMGPGFRPLSAEAQGGSPFLFSAVVTLEPAEEGTLYRAVAIHADEAGCRAHEEMGFHAGWGAALDQLVALVKRT